jgi:hypothetical protein
MVHLTRLAYSPLWHPMMEWILHDELGRVRVKIRIGVCMDGLKGID